MRVNIPEMAIGLPILLLWLGIVAAILAGYAIFRWWRQRHPHKVPSSSYSRQLPTRLNSRGGAKPGAVSLGAKRR